MKISPVAPGAGPNANPDEGRSAGSARVARAKAILTGGTAQVTPVAQAEQNATHAQEEREQRSVKRIKMRTNATPLTSEAVLSQANNPEPAKVENVTPEAATGDVSDQGESTEEASEATKPLSPQFAALMKRERALQVKEKAIEARERALSEKEQGTNASPDIGARIKSDPLSVLDEHGVTYDQLTEAILARNQDPSTAYKRLKAEVEAEITKRFEDQSKQMADRDQQTKAQVVAQMQKDADKIVSASGDTYEMVREAGYAKKAVELVERTFDETGELMDLEEALGLIENELVEEALKFSRLKKVQTKLTPAPQPQGQPSQTKPIRTLTNRDGASPQLSKRERAILAAQGKLYA